MKIGIDCRLWDESGIGRYIQNLITTLNFLDTKNEYVLFLLPKDINNKKISSRFKKVSADVRWHTLKEQFVMPKVFLRENLDILHIPYINMPLFYPKKFVATIHDLTPIKYPTSSASKRSFPIYHLKLCFYYLTLFFGVRKAFKVIAVSESAKSDMVKFLKISPKKVKVVYNFNVEFDGTRLPKKNRENYLLYVGNAYPHKNLPRLIKAFEIFVSKFSGENISPPNLLLVGKEDYFYKKLKDIVPLGIKDKVVFVGFSDVEKLERLYISAKFVVNPSLYEGFGFPLIEAFSLGTLVVCSTIPVFKEIAKSAVLYFNPLDVEDMAEKMFTAFTMSKNDYHQYVEKGYKNLSYFNPEKEVKKVLEIYKEDRL